jgi:hypothetical protein
MPPNNNVHIHPITNIPNIINIAFYDPWISINNYILDAISPNKNVSPAKI